MKSLYELFFYYPGRLIMWFFYFFPSGGFEGVAQSGRQYREGGYIIAFMMSVLFWGVVIFCLGAYWFFNLPEAEMDRILIEMGFGSN